MGKITYGINAPVTLDMVKQVKLGMTPEQVRKIMGRPGNIPYHRPLANEQNGTAEGWLSDDLNLSASYLYGELVAKEVQDDDLYPKGVKIESLSAELTGEQLVDVMCKHVQECIEMRASEREDATAASSK
ncbi:MAG: outer membrane protein assembly factor BamE [Proteobacteria bacterium]|nr:MAG: outer membrane protein assembly factor BamE [Pseudomonadota bacterium]